MIKKRRAIKQKELDSKLIADLKSKSRKTHKTKIRTLKSLCRLKNDKQILQIPNKINRSGHQTKEIEVAILLRMRARAALRFYRIMEWVRKSLRRKKYNDLFFRFLTMYLSHRFKIV